MGAAGRSVTVAGGGSTNYNRPFRLKRAQVLLLNRSMSQIDFTEVLLKITILLL